jgi:hypothetical protein
MTNIEKIILGVTDILQGVVGVFTFGFIYPSWSYDLCVKFAMNKAKNQHKKVRVQ